MIDRLLKSHLEPVARSSQKWQLWRGLAVCWAALALAGWAAVHANRSHGWYSPLTFFVLAAAGVVASFLVVRYFRFRPLDYQTIARQIELENPELHSLLLTAVEQEPNSPGGELNYLQQRVVLEALAHHRRSAWAAGMSRRHRIALGAHWLAFACFVAALAALLPHFSLSLPGGLWASAEQSNGVLVTPGDAQMERGSSLVVLARFNARLPASAELVVTPDSGAEQRIALTKNLDDPVFGGGVPELTNNLKYHIEFTGGRTRDFKIGVFEYPRLDHADVTITYPAYTGVAQKFIKNTRRVSAVEGSSLDYVFYLNKPVVSARLVATNESAVALTVDATNSSLYHAKIALTESHRYDLVLVDDAGRSNKVPPEFVLEALKNHAPVVRLTAPHGDQSVSALEEMNFAGEASGEYGLKSYGISYALGGGETKTIELGQTAKAGEKRQLNYTLPLESLGAQPDQLLSYYIWADDTGPDGQPRRTTSDIYFAEIKPYDQIFREAQQPDAGDDQNNNRRGGGGGGGGGNQPDSLANLEKQIVTATFNLQRRESGAKPSDKYKDDVQVVQNSQQDALSQLQDLKQQNDDQTLAPYIDSAEKAMATAARQLGDAADKNSLTPLPPALTAEQTAYQAVLKLQAREFQVARGQRGQRGGQQRGGQRMQAQLNQLDLAQQDDQYQTQRQANADQGNQTPQQQEQLQVANRLKELAQRQQDLNQRMRELQASLQEARTDQQRADIRDQLKRLTEEQQNLLSDVDELRQRMDQQANQQQGQQQPGDQQQGDQQQARLEDGQQPQPDGQPQPDQQPGQQQGQQQAGGQQRGGQQQGNQQQAQQAQQRQQLEQTRNEVQNAADQLAQNNPDQALASGTRAQQELQQLQDDVRRMNSAQFSEEMRQMRNDARQLAQNQEDIGNQINQLANPAQRQLTDTDEQKQLRTDLSTRLLQQENAASNLLDQMREVSDKSETAEPILSQQLYDTIRQTQPDDLNSALDSSSELVRRSFAQQAAPYESRARTNINQLRNGVEQAAQNVLGDGTEALRLAQRELDQLNRELNESAQAAGLGTNGTNGGLAAGQRPGRNGQNGQRGQGQNGEDQNQQLANNGNDQNSGQQNGQEPDQGQEPGNGRAGNRPGNRAGQGNRTGQPGNGQPAQDQNQPGQNPGQLAGGGNPNGETPDARGGRPGQLGGQRNGGNRPGGAGFGTNGLNAGFAGDTNAADFAGGADGTNGQMSETLRRLMARRAQEEGYTNGADFAGNTNGLDFTRGPGGVGTNETGVNFAGGGPGGNFVYGGGGINYGGDYNGPIVDTNYIAWSDRLRVVEEMVNDVPDLSTQVAQIRDRARELRLAYRRDNKKPDWAVVTEQISQPLAEVRARVDEELLKRTSKDALVPLDRDPVPSQYSERVRRYYEQLGKSD